MIVGDRVLVAVAGRMRAARVIEPMTALGNVEVELDVPIFDERLAPVSLGRFVRAPDDVYPMWPTMAVYQDAIETGRQYDDALERVLRPPVAVNMRGDLVSLDTPLARHIAKAFNVPDAVIGIPTPRWRRFVQRWTRRSRQRAKRRQL